MSSQQEQETDRNVEVWKIKKLIKSLQAARGFVNFKIHSKRKILKNNIDYIIILWIKPLFKYFDILILVMEPA